MTKSGSSGGKNKIPSLVEQHFNLKLNIHVYSNDQISANKKTHEHDGAYQSFAIPNEKVIDSTLSNASKKTNGGEVALTYTSHQIMMKATCIRAYTWPSLHLSPYCRSPP